MSKNKVLSYLSGLLYFISYQIFAQNGLYKPNLLIQEGIDPQILNLAVATFSPEVALTLDTTQVIESNNKKTKLNYKLLYDPFTNYGIDLRLQVPKQYEHLLAGKDISNTLDEIMALQIKLGNTSVYDPDSFKIVSKTEQQTVISFTLLKDEIPYEIKQYRSFKGYVYITSHRINKIVISNQESFEDQGIDVTIFEKELTFNSVPFNGGYLLQGIKIEKQGIKNGEKYHSLINAVVSSYQNHKLDPVSFSGGIQKKTPFSESDYKTYYVELDRIFPLFGQEARKQGYDLPKPFGISMISMLQETTMHMTSFAVNGKDVGNLVGGDDAKVVNSSAVMLVRADMWLLPFLNVGLIVGKTQTLSDITLQVLPNGFNPSIPIFDDIGPGDYFTVNDAKSSSVVYGGGATIAGGVGNYFGTVDLQYVTAYTKKADAELKMSIITPIVGYHFKEIGLRALLGAQYQDTANRIVANFVKNQVVVGLRSKKWTGLVGVEKSFARHWSSSLMFSYGEDRNNLNLVVGYRF
ncbi:hypothetical protein E2R68_03050 [Psychromonas sp. RZ22]|uniref:hypothetical protein n=1 Tax=Psychromonas algarum TaxID=2555643 RepID=UPI0010673FC2|nr:hypothetical protein [Psychromonas sp. RZ22]TEW56084.1 hypothetical protein E2R68_03050 [Psychromonas sp. RZ22]